MPSHAPEPHHPPEENDGFGCMKVALCPGVRCYTITSCGIALVVVDMLHPRPRTWNLELKKNLELMEACRNCACGPSFLSHLCVLEEEGSLRVSLGAAGGLCLI